MRFSAGGSTQARATCVDGQTRRCGPDVDGPESFPAGNSNRPDQTQLDGWRGAGCQPRLPVETSTSQEGPLTS